MRNLGKSLERWGKSDEVEHLKALDKKFLASPEGKRLVAEWKDFGHALKKHLKETENGVHIANAGMDEISDELDDVADQYKKLEGSKWDKAYTKGWEAATHSKEAAAVGRRFHTFEKSDEAHALGKELKDLDQAIKENLKVTDIPEDWKKEQNLLHIKINNAEDIEDEWDDVEETWDDIKDSRPVRNLGQSLEDWGTSQEMKDLEALDKKFIKSPRGQKLRKEWMDVFKELDGAVYHNDQGHIHIDNGKIDEVEDELKDVEAQYKALKKTHWAKEYHEAFKDVFSNKEFQKVGRRAEAFKHSKQGKALKAELKDFKQSLKENVEVTDVPEDWKKNLFLF